MKTTHTLAAWYSSCDDDVQLKNVAVAIWFGVSVWFVLGRTAEITKKKLRGAGTAAQRTSLAVATTTAAASAC